MKRPVERLPGSEAHAAICVNANVERIAKTIILMRAMKCLLYREKVETGLTG
jgi:hypothetical protein